MDLTRNERIARLLGYFVVDRDGDACPGLLVPRDGPGWHRYGWAYVVENGRYPTTVCIDSEAPAFDAEWSLAIQVRAWAALDDARWQAWSVQIDWRTATPAQLCDAALVVAEGRVG